MEKKVIIFGKDNCPYTRAAREAYTERKIDFLFIDVLKDPSQMDRMLALSQGVRKVPVILDNGTVIVGHEGKG
jgi:glutaredoxin